MLIGVEANSQLGADLHIAVGPGYLKNPDGILGGHFQINTEMGIGLSDRHVKVKAIWAHLHQVRFIPSTKAVIFSWPKCKSAW